jgi:flavin-binding protein dodecin
VGGRIGQFLGAVSSRGKDLSGRGIHDDGADGNLAASGGGFRLRQGQFHGRRRCLGLQHFASGISAWLRGACAGVKRRRPTCRTCKRMIASSAAAPSCLVPRLSMERSIFIMSDHTYQKIEIVGSSPTSIEDAIQGAIARAAKMHSNMNWFEVVETRGHISNGKVAHYQVVLKVGFRLED